MKMFKDKTQIRDFIKNNNIKTAKDIHDVLKDLFKDVLQEALESEINSDLGYQKYDSKNKHTDNSRNGYSKKSVISSSGKLELDIPRDRKGEFEPKIVKKYDRNISDIESKILALYARGNSTRDINCYLKEIYGVDVSADLVSRITDKIMPDVREWQNRPLDNTYAFVLLDAMFFNVREDGRVVKKAVYIVLGINLNGMKDVLGIYIGEAESSRFWLSVLNNIKERGLEDILIVSVDGLKGFKEAIETVYPKAEVQRCIVHQIRHSTRFVSYKDIKALHYRY